jgi:hypothetical protein
VYDVIHKTIVIGLIGGSIVGTYLIYSELSRLKKLKAKEISEKQRQAQSLQE